MSSKPSRPCAFPRCKALVKDTRYCEEHQEHDARKRYDREKGTRQERGYGTAWQALRKDILLRDLYTCQMCGGSVGMHKGDAHVDHIIAKEKGGTDDESNLQTLCAGCHSRKTNAEDGGFGHHH